MKQERFYPREIIRDPEAKVKHFTPTEGHKDRFGNRFFSSPNLAYLDGAGDKVKAGLLISPEGQSFIEKNKSILQDIDWGLSVLEGGGKNAPERSVDLRPGRTLEAVTVGGQSNFYVLTINRDKYAIKTHATKRAGREELHQPYINEMLQTQSVAEDLKKELETLKIKMATFFFASGQVSCTWYEKNTGNYNPSQFKLLERLEDVMLPYLYEQHNKHNPLWENADIDIPTSPGDKADTIMNNFRIQPDGTLVWIDPFVFFRPEPPASQ